MKSKAWFLSTKVWAGVAAALLGLATALPDLGEAGPVVRGVLGTLAAVVGAWVVVLRALEGEDPDSPEDKLTMGGGSERGSSTSPMMLTVMVAVAGSLFGWAITNAAISCAPLTPRQEGAITTGVQGGVGLTCDVLGQLFPDNAWVSVGCAAGKIVAVGVLAATMGLDGAEDSASKAATVDYFAPDSSPTLHLGCGAMALRCHRYGGVAVADYCAEVLASCDAGVSSVVMVRGE